MKRVGMRNKIISRYWQGMTLDDIRRTLGCTKQTIDKWTRPLKHQPQRQWPQILLSLGWTPGELMRVLKIEESELNAEYGIEFKARGYKTLSDEQLIEYIDMEMTPQEMAEESGEKLRYIKNRLRELGWVKVT